jgi:hypothetical protein
MFGLIKDLAGIAGSVVGAVVGSIVGLSTSVVAGALGVTASAAQEAIDSGCETYEEVRDFLNL